MARVTITLSDERYERLKSQAAVRQTTVAGLVEAELAQADADRRQRAMAILEKARANAATAESPLSEEELLDLAVYETHAVRREMAAERDARSHR